MNELYVKVIVVFGVEKVVDIIMMIININVWNCIGCVICMMF